MVGWILLALTVALINASSGLTALWVLLAGVAYVLFICFPMRWAYRWLAKKTGSLDAGMPSTMMMTITIVLVLISGFYTDIIGIHAIFVSGLTNPTEAVKLKVDAEPTTGVASWQVSLFPMITDTLSRLWRRLRILSLSCSFPW